MGDYTPQSRSEEILYDTIHSLEYTERPQSRIEELLLELKAVIEAGSGTSDYEELEHLPKINSVELKGDKLSDLGAASEGAVAAKASQSDIAPTFSDATAYTDGDVVYHEGSLYRFTADHSAGAWDSAAVESVTVDDLVDGLKPVDSVTDGDMRPVTSNATYDHLNEYVEVTSVEGDTRKTIYNKLNALVDWNKVGRNSHLVTSSGYPYIYSGGHTFILIQESFDTSNVVLELDKVKLDSTNSYHKIVFYRTGVGTGSFSSVSGNISDYSDTELTEGQKFRLYYR